MISLSTFAKVVGTNLIITGSGTSRPANLRVGQCVRFGFGAIDASMIVYIKLWKLGQKSHAFSVFLRGDCVSLTPNA